MYTPEQRKLISYIRVKVKNFFGQHSAKAHGFDHALRVSKWAVVIAKYERSDVFLSEISGLLHDIGRVREEFPGNTKRHHELSYEMCKEWFGEDRNFDVLTKEEKLTILYSLRYHWNNAADKYKVAWILRDADKLDAFGTIGLKRAIEFFDNDEEKIMKDMRGKADMVLNLRSKKAKLIVKKKDLFAPLQRYHIKLLKKKIEPVDL